MNVHEGEKQEQTAMPQKRRRSRVKYRQKMHKCLFAMAFTICIVVFLVLSLVLPDKAFSDTENRNLAQFPAVSVNDMVDGSWFEGVNSWFNDQFPFRDGWIALRSGWQRLTGQKESGQVLFGKGYLISVPETPNEKTLSATVAAMNTFAAQYPEVQSYAMVVPGSAAILSEKLPKGAPVRDQAADVRAIENALVNVKSISAIEALQEKKDAYIYYRTDHHWTSLGAYTAFSVVAQQMQLAAPEFTFYPVCKDFKGTLASRSGFGSYQDTVEICKPERENFYYYVSYDENTEKSCSMFQSQALEAKDKYTVFLGGNHAKLEISTTAETGRTLLLFKDSYANSFTQFLLPCFDRIIMIDPRYYYGEIASLMNGVTDVLFLYSADTLVKDPSLADVLATAKADEQTTAQEQTAQQEEQELQPVESVQQEQLQDQPVQQQEQQEQTQ